MKTSVSHLGSLTVLTSVVLALVVLAVSVAITYGNPHQQAANDSGIAILADDAGFLPEFLGDQCADSSPYLAGLKRHSRVEGKLIRRYQARIPARLFLEGPTYSPGQQYGKRFVRRQRRHGSSGDQAQPKRIVGTRKENAMIHAQSFLKRLSPGLLLLTVFLPLLLAGLQPAHGQYVEKAKSAPDWSSLPREARRAIVAAMTKDSVSWTQQAELTASDGGAGDSLGGSVAVDGNTVVVGAPRHMVGSSSHQGAVYVFVQSDGTWVEQAELTASDGAAGDQFGYSVAVSGSTVVVGAPYHTVGSNPSQGAAYVFVQSGGTWSQQAELSASDGARIDYFGYSVAVDGSTIVVGASNHIDGGARPGAAYVFVESSGTWSQQAELTASHGGNDFGLSVAINGNIVVVGAPGYAVGSNSGQGAAYVFVESSGTWIQQAELTASDGVAYDYFGISVAVDGSTVVVGAWSHKVGSNPGQGAAYVFVQSGGTWIQQAELTASDGIANDSFGYSVALSGGTAVAGAFDHTVGSNSYQGAAYVFVQNGEIWSQQTELTASDGDRLDQFGRSVAVSGSTAAVGAYSHPNSGAGAAYVFESSSPGYALSSSPSSLSIAQGGQGTTTITITPVNGFSGSVSLSASGLPNGVTASFNPNPATSTSTLTLSASGTAAAGTAVTVTGTSSGLMRTTTLTVTVIITPSYTLSASPSSLSLVQGSEGTSTIVVTPLYGFSASVALSASGLPSGITAGFNPNPATSTSTLTLTASGTATLGTSTVAITGTSGSLIETTTVTPTVTRSPAQENVIFSFNGLDGMTSLSGLVAGPSGNFYGVTSIGGNANCDDWGGGIGCGTVYELIPPAGSGGAWTETVLYNFQGGADGDEVVASLILDAQGNLYGVTELGGGGTCTYGCGTVFELSPPATQGASWTKSTLYTFQGGMTDGSYPEGALVFDAHGNLYGTTFFGGSSNCGGYGCGTAFELSPTKTGSGWNETVLHVFVGAGNGDGYLPNNNLVFDAKGNLYGAADSGGAYNNGAVFELSPPTEQGGNWTEQVIYSFIGAPDGANPESGLTPGANGVFYGVASTSGPAGYGTVYQLAPPTLGSNQWTLTVLFSFNLKAAGGNPWGPLLLDASGNLYGTTAVGGDYSCPSEFNDGCGVVFELVNSSGKYNEEVLHSFTGSGGDGIQPESGVTSDASGNLYGTTELGGTYGHGIVFELLNSLSTPPAQMLLVTVGDIGGATGNITSSPAGINCPISIYPCTASFSWGTVVTLTATPGANSVFQGWNGACSGTGTCSVTMNSTAEVSATFTPPPATATTTTLVSSLNPSQWEQPVTFTATVAGTNGTPTGTVTFYANTEPMLTQTLSNGAAQYTTSSLLVGSTSMTAVYGGDTKNLGSTSSALSQTVNPASQSITFTTNPPATAAYLSNFTVAATATSLGWVAFTSSGSCINTGTVYQMTSGTGTCSVIANQAGNGSWLPAPTVTQTVSATPASQTVTFNTSPPVSAIYNSSFSVAASASSSLPVSYTSSGSCNNSGATYTITNGAGACSVIANQSGNGNYSAAPQVTKTVNATPATTSIAVTSVSPAAEDYGLDAPVTITAVLSWTGSGSAPKPGAVTISGNGLSNTYGTTSCGAPTGDTMICTNTYTPTIADGQGSYTETATFSGDGNYSGSSSSQADNFAITPASATTAISSSSNPSTYSQPVIFTATITGENTLVKGRTNTRKNGAKPMDVGGTVTWSANTGCGTTPVTTGNPGVATCTTSALTVGTDAITAIYSGDSNHSGSTGTLNGGEVVNQVSANVSIGSTLNPSVYGQAVSFTANVTGSTPTGIVRFRIDGNPFGAPITLASGSATSNVMSTLTQGTHAVTATYSGDTNNSGSTGTLNGGQVVNAAGAGVSVASSLNPSMSGEAVTFTATISGASGLVRGRKPMDVSGTVVWSSTTGCGTTAVIAGNPGTASCTTVGLASGTDTISATYSGDSNHSGGVGTLIQVVYPPLTCTVPPSEVYGGSFTVSCAGGAPGVQLVFASAGSCSNVGPTYNMTSGTGSCTVTVTQPGSPVPPVPLTVSATQVPQSISCNPPRGAVVINSRFNMSCTTTSGVPVTYGSSGDCSNAGATYTAGKTVGTCVAMMNAAGNSNYAAAPQVIDSIPVVRAIAPTVSFAGAPSTAVYQSTFTVVATSNSGVAPTITAAPSTVCTMNGDVVTMASGTGTCTLTAKWAANAPYSTATATQKTAAEKLDSGLAWATPAPITYGTKLSATQLDATASVAGKFGYSPAAGTKPAVPTPPATCDTLKVTFTPTQTADYTKETATVCMVVIPN